VFASTLSSARAGSVGGWGIAQEHGDRHRLHASAMGGCDARDAGRRRSIASMPTRAASAQKRRQYNKQPSSSEWWAKETGVQATALPPFPLPLLFVLALSFALEVSALFEPSLDSDFESADLLAALSSPESALPSLPSFAPGDE
jgi:hypothetical protein